MSTEKDFETLANEMRNRAREVARAVLEAARPRGDVAGGYCAATTGELAAVLSGLGTALAHAVRTFGEAGAIDDVTASQLYQRIESVTLDAQAALLEGARKPRVRPQDLN